MNRRKFLSSLALGAIGVGGSVSARAYQNCNPMGSCEVGINIGKLQKIYAAQKKSQWCWAASIQMVFHYYGYQVSQHAIVETIYGSAIDMPALSGAVISSALSRHWVDENGKEFYVQLNAAYDADFGVSAINNGIILESLASEAPLIYGNHSHAMVLTAAAFNMTPAGPYIWNLGFMDPWPGRGLRGLDNPGELVAMHQGGQIRYIALPVISAA